MFFVSIALICLIFACLPVPIGIPGRVIPLLNSAWNFVYGAAVIEGQGPRSIGVLGRYLDLSPTPFSAVTVTAVLSCIVALIAVLAFRKRSASILTSGVRIAVPKWLSALVLGWAYVASLYVLGTVGISNIMSYSGYGSLKALHVIYYGNPIGLLVASTLRPMLLVLVLIATLSLSKRRYGYVALALIPIGIGFMIGLAEAGRIVSIYFGVAAIGFLVTGRRKAALVCGVLSILAVAYALESRSHTVLGLRSAPNHLSLALRKAGVAEDVLTNVAAGQFVTSASARMGNPAAYEFAYKAMSFLPTVDAIDGFQSVKMMNEQRVNEFIPFNAFAEAYLFGPVWLVLFWSILGASVYSINSAAKHGAVLHLLLLCIFCLGWSYATQYPIRNALRYFYLIIALRVAAPIFIRWWRHRRAVLARHQAVRSSSFHWGRS